MVKAVVQQVDRFTLTMELSLEELVKLSSMVQNPICGFTCENEPEDIKSIRKAIFHACTQHRT